MVFYDVVYWSMKQIWYYQRHVKGLHEVMMQEREELKRFYKQDYGGLPFTKMLSNSTKVVTFFIDLESHPREMKFP
jgi:hypothetical protein